MSSSAVAADREPLLNNSTKDAPNSPTILNKKADDEKSSQTSAQKHVEVKDGGKGSVDNAQSEKNTIMNRKKGSNTDASAMVSPATKSPSQSLANSTKNVTNNKTEPSVKSTEDSREGIEWALLRQQKGPKRDDPNIYKWTWKYTSAMIFYLLGLWLVLAIFTTIVMTPMLLIAQEGPAIFGEGSFIGQIPALYYQPRMELSYSHIDEAQIGAFQAQLMTFFERYNNTAPKVCNSIRKAHVNGSYTDLTCPSVDIYSDDELFGLGECRAEKVNMTVGLLHQWGFSKSKPCLAISFTKIFGVYPTLEEVKYERILSLNRGISENENTQIRKGITKLCSNLSATQDCCEKYRFTVKCAGKNTDDGKDLEFDYFPKAGASLCPLPFWNQKNYQQPFVMVQVKGLKKGETMVSCQPLAESWSTFKRGGDAYNRIDVKINLKSDPVDSFDGPNNKKVNETTNG